MPNSYFLGFFTTLNARGYLGHHLNTKSSIYQILYFCSSMTAIQTSLQFTPNSPQIT